MSNKPVNLACLWTVKERVMLPISRKKVWHPVLQNWNTFTTTGLTSLASAISGNYVAPVYLALANNAVQFQSATSPGGTTLTLTAQIDQSGDTQLVLSLGLANQETVTFSSSVAAVGGGWQYTLSAGTTYSHAIGEQVTRAPNANDALSNIIGEVQYDPTNSPSLRPTSIAGYSGGTGSWTTQFYFVASTAVSYISDIGLTDSMTIGAGELHNHVVLGYDHSGGLVDVEIDGQLTLTNV